MHTYIHTHTHIYIYIYIYIHIHIHIYIYIYIYIYICIFTEILLMSSIKQLLYSFCIDAAMTNCEVMKKYVDRGFFFYTFVIV